MKRDLRGIVDDFRERIAQYVSLSFQDDFYIDLLLRIGYERSLEQRCSLQNGLSMPRVTPFEKNSFGRLPSRRSTL